MMVGARQSLQGKPHNPVKIILPDPGHRPPRHVQATDGHRGQVIADHPDPLPIKGRGHRIGHWVVGLRFCGEGQHRDAAVDTGAELLFELISQRYERGATLITSNLPFDEWTETFGSERLTGALLDRLTHHVNILEMNGDSYRLGQSRARKSAATN